MSLLRNLNDLIAELDELERKGQDSVYIDPLVKRLTLVAENGKESDDHSRLKNEITLANISHRSASGIAMFNSVIESGKDALKALLIINGGAVVALLTFIGQIFSSEASPETVSMIAKSMYQFTWGLLCASMGFSTRYLSQSSYGKEKPSIGDAFSSASVLLAISSLLFFFLGALGTYKAMS